MEIANRLFRKSFRGVTREAAIKALTKYQIALIDNKLPCMFRVTDQNDSFELEVFCTLDAQAEQKQFCERCKEIHSSFYINARYNCNSCNMKALFTRLESKATIGKQSTKEKVKLLKEKGIL